MQRGTPVFLKAIIGLIGFAVLCVCFLLAPELVREDAADGHPVTYMKYVFLAGVYTLAVPVLFALYQAWKLANNIANDKVFTQSSVRAVRNIKYAAATFGFLILAGVLVSALTGRSEGEDVTGSVALGFIFTLAAGTIATFMAVLERLLQNAVDIKSENDSTV